MPKYRDRVFLGRGGTPPRFDEKRYELPQGSSSKNGCLGTPLFGYTPSLIFNYDPGFLDKVYQLPSGNCRLERVWVPPTRHDEKRYELP